MPTAPPMRLPIPKLNPSPKTHPNPNPNLIFFSPNPFLKENNKQHQNIGQLRVIFTGYLLRDAGRFMSGP